jgi:hypothetical protein
MSFDVHLNVPAAVLAGVATFNTRFGDVSSILAGAAAGFAIGPLASLKNHKASATPFRYISSFYQ